MGEWIRHRGSKSMPKRLEGMRFEVRRRNGVVCELKGDPYCVKHPVTWKHASYDSGNDIMAYRILEDEPAQPDTNGWIEWHGGECPVAEGTLVDVKFRDGREVSSTPANVIDDRYSADASADFWKDDGSFSDIVAYRLSKPDWPEDRVDVIGQNGNDGLHYGADTHLGIKRPDGDGWVKYNAGDVVDISDVVTIDFVSGHWPDEVITSETPNHLEFAPNEPGQIAWYRLNYDVKTDAATRHVTPEGASLLDDIGIVDMVNEPPHYKQGDVECIDAIRAALTDEEWRGYCKGNALKYIWRERHKGGYESLQKAIWYLNRLVK